MRYYIGLILLIGFVQCTVSPKKINIKESENSCAAILNDACTLTDSLPYQISYENALIKLRNELSNMPKQSIDTLKQFSRIYLLRQIGIGLDFISYLGSISDSNTFNFGPDDSIKEYSTILKLGDSAKKYSLLLINNFGYNDTSEIIQEQSGHSLTIYQEPSKEYKNYILSEINKEKEIIRNKQIYMDAAYKKMFDGY